MPAFDPAQRKTVSCPELEAAFLKDPHPDGKTMNALADKLKLNKKQVSNFFERERRKANIVIESRRKGGNGGGGGSSGNSSCSGSVNGSVKGSATKVKQSTSVAHPSPGSHRARNISEVTITTSSAKNSKGSNSADKTFSPSSSVAIALSRTQSNEGSDAPSNNTKRSTRGVRKKESYYRAFEDGDDDEEDDAEGDYEDEYDDAEGEYYEDEDTVAPALEEEEDELQTRSVQLESQKISYQEELAVLASAIDQQKQNPLVQKNKENRDGAGSSSRYTSRNARYASRSPLYAFPASQTLDNFRNAPPPPPQPSMRRTSSNSPSIHSRSPSPLTAGNGQSQQSTLLTAYNGVVSSKHLAAPAVISKHGSRSSSVLTSTAEHEDTAESHKRKRNAALSESPTVMFLRNPFPAPVPSQTQFSLRPALSRQASFQSMLEEDPRRDISLIDFASAATLNSSGEMLLDPYQPTRKKARVWFSKPSIEAEGGETSPESVNNSTGRDFGTSRPRTTKQSQAASVDDVQPTNTEPRVTRAPPARTQRETKTRADAQPPSSDNEEEENSSDDSIFGDDGGVKAKKKDNRPGAALRTNIACKELKQAFVSNPHPPADVLEALAARLGLGKKQVSNYFVRERKKAGYTIKVRHGLHRRRGPNKKKVDKPEVVVTQHDDDAPSELGDMAPSSSQDMTLNGLNEFMGEDESDDGVSNVSAHIHDMAIDSHSYLPQMETSASGKDDVPDLSYDDAIGSSLMMPSKSLESMAASSRQDEDEELASPPFEALHLPPTDESDKLGRSVSQGILGYDSHGLPASSSIRLI